MEVNKVMHKALILLTVCTVAVLAAPSAFAAGECGFSVPVGNAFSTYVSDCPDGKPVAAYAYAWDNAAINSGLVDIACEALGGSGGACVQALTPPNISGDNNVTIETNWATPGFNGCIATPSAHRMIIVLQCNDGSGVKMSMSGNSAFGYQLELALETDDGTNVFPLSLHHTYTGTPREFDNGRPKVTGTVTRSGGNDLIPVNVPIPCVDNIQSDCKDGSLGKLVDDSDGSLGCASFRQAMYGPDGVACTADDTGIARGRLFHSTQPCPSASFRPNTAIAAWVLDSTPLANGSGVVSLPTAATGQCNYLGTTSVINGVDSNSIDGYVAIAPANAISPMAQSIGATKKGNSIEISFSTSSELGLAGFNAFTGSKGKGEIKLNATLIAPKGVGGAGASYTLSFPIGDFKGGHSITIESVLSDGTTLRAPAINF